MKTRIIPIVFLSLLPGLVQALGLGPITTQSYLNQPFSARIEIISATVSELDSLIAVPGDAKAFQRAGLEFTPDIKKLQFKVISIDEGEHYIQVSSQDPVRDPVLSFIVEARWNTGQMTRTYTVLLDPPFYAAMENRQSLAKKETRPLPEKSDHPVISEEPPRPGSGSQTISAKAEVPVGSSASTHDWTVAAGDTLWAIANNTRPDSSISTDQMMLAIMQANPDAFINNNINNIKLGSTLHIPEIDKIQAIDKQEATDKVRKQYGQWKNEQVATTDTTNITADSGQPGLRILTPDSDTGDVQGNTGPGTGGDTDLHSLKKELALTAESVESYRTENAELEVRLAAAEARINDLRAELKKGLPMDVSVHEEPVNDLYGPVAAGETLWNIANKIRPDISISTNQMMLALLRANPEAFINGNINQLRRGAVLHMPEIQDIQSLSKGQATEEVKSHYTLWKRRE
jgi:pilus assembly protein FimV